MTLDDLIEKLEDLKRTNPSAGIAHVQFPGSDEPAITYSSGQVFIDRHHDCEQQFLERIGASDSQQGQRHHPKSS